MNLNALGGGGEVSIVSSGGILDGDQDVVSTLATLGSVVGLEVVRGFGEAIAVGQVMDRVDEVEGIHARSIEIGSDSGRQGVIVSVVEDEACCALSSGTGDGGLVRCNIVSTDVVVLVKYLLQESACHTEWSCS